VEVVRDDHSHGMLSHGADYPPKSNRVALLT
jgi:hypothetical protein